MIEDKNHTSIKNLFYFFTIGFIILCIKVKIKGLPPMESIKTLFFTFGYIYIISIWFGLAGMFTVDIYIAIKKKLENVLIYDSI